MAGIKETKEALVGVNEVAVHVVKKFKDGVDVQDFISFYNDFVSDPEFKAKLEAAWNGYQAIPEEVKDLDIGEVVELGAVQLSYVPKFVGALVS